MANEYKGLVDITTGIEIADANANGVFDLSSKQTGKQKNYIIGGDFSKNPWQIGDSFTGPSDGDYSADMFEGRYQNNWLVYDATKSTNAPTVAQVGILTNHSLRFEVTTESMLMGLNDFWYMNQKIEGYNYKDLAQRNMNLSISVRTNKIGTYNLCLRNEGLDRYYVVPITVNVADIWERKSVKIAASPSGGTWNYTNGTGINVSVILSAGSFLNAPATETWATGNLISSAGQVNLMDTIGNYFEIDLVQLEPGDKETRFEERTIQEELVLCQRYYEKSFNQDVAPVQQANEEFGCLQYRSHIAGVFTETLVRNYNVEKRAAPTNILYSTASLNSTWRNSTMGTDSGIAVVEPFSSASTKQIVVRNPQVVGDGLGHLMLLHWSADARL